MAGQLFGRSGTIPTLMVLAMLGLAGACQAPQVSPATPTVPAALATSPSVLPSPVPTAQPLPTREPGTPLPFATIERIAGVGAGATGTVPLGKGPVTKARRDRSPAVAVAASADDAGRLSVPFTREAAEVLQSTDYTRQLLVVAFQGLKGSTEYGVTIERVVRHGSTVDVEAMFIEPRPDQITQAAETSPYHLIRVDKVGTWGQDITFNLVVGYQVVASASRYIP